MVAWLLPVLLFSFSLKRDPFHVADVQVEQHSRYDIMAPKVVGIIVVDNKQAAIIRFDDITEVVYVGSFIKGFRIVRIGENFVEVQNWKEKKQWVM
jgi:hypothetical protein